MEQIANFTDVVDIVGNVKLHLPKVSDVLILGEDEYRKIMLPYTVDIDTFFDDDAKEMLTDEQLEDLDIFELFFSTDDDGNSLLGQHMGANPLSLMEKSLSLLFKNEVIKVLPNRKKILIGELIIDKVEFKKLRKLIQVATTMSELKIEKPPKNMSKRKRDIWDKLQEGRRRKAEMEKVSISDIAHCIAFGGKSYVPMGEVYNMTYLQFTNAYRVTLLIDTYNTGLAYTVSQKFDVKEDLKHWSETIKKKY